MSNVSSSAKGAETRKKILIAYIPNLTGKAVFEAGLQEATAKECVAVLVNVARTGRAVDRKMIDEGEKAELVTKAEAAGAALEILQPFNTDAVAAIEDLVETGEFSELVIGLPRRSAVGKFVLGSTAQRLLLGIDIPILGVKPEVA